MAGWLAGWKREERREERGKREDVIQASRPTARQVGECPPNVCGVESSARATRGTSGTMTKGERVS